MQQDMREAAGGEAVATKSRNDALPDPIQFILQDHDRQVETSLPQSYLFFCNAESDRFAVPLEVVERIEKIEATQIETVGGSRVVQYRGGTLPLLNLEDAVTVNPLAERDHYQVICFYVGGREIGLLSAPPIDAIEVELALDTKTLKRPFFLAAIPQSRANSIKIEGSL